MSCVYISWAFIFYLCEFKTFSKVKPSIGGVLLPILAKFCLCKTRKDLRNYLVLPHHHFLGKEPEALRGQACPGQSDSVG